MDNPTTSRKFIDLILKASAKWANWNPPYEIKVGDYGKVDKKTGEFNRYGNIYTDTHIYEDENIVKLVNEHPPISAAREEVYMASSPKVKRSDLKLDGEVEIPGLANASIKGQWAFGPKRGALLIMANPCVSYFPPKVLLEHLADVPALKEMFLVTEVFSCPAYSLYLSTGNNEIVNLALVGSFPVPPGGEFEGKWWAQNTNGLFRSARDRYGKDNFTPLYMLKMIRGNKGWFRRGERFPPRKGDERWCDAYPTWDPLDDDGNEVEFEDTVFE